MTTLEVIENVETVYCDIHSDYVNSAECVECEMTICAECLRSYGCDNC